MIRYEHRDSRLCPRVYCDACLKVVTDAAKAVALWKNADEDSEVLHAHKGHCSAALGRMYRYWEDLNRHLAQLTCNVKMDLGKKQLELTVDPMAEFLR